MKILTFDEFNQNNSINEGREAELKTIYKNLHKDPDFLAYLKENGVDRTITQSQLTMGLCTHVAKYIADVLGIGEALGSFANASQSGVSHAFIKYNNKYYDSATPNGVKHVWELWLFDDFFYTLRTDDKSEEYFKKEIEKNIAEY